MTDVNVSGPINERDIEIMRNRIIENLCRELRLNREESFHMTDMNRRHVRAYLQGELELDEAQFSEESTEYKEVLKRVYSPLFQYGLIAEYENNNFRITNRFKELCNKELRTKGWIDWKALRKEDL